ncbi:YbfB/YjiJ family MFS transporter, partial [Escherichia coli]|nr:YbfB/YjiJ family MFS transporter [Escherichia coli]
MALAGLLALATAMGIGRFAFTPLLPMMLHDGVIDLTAGSWLATANYLGYWLGAMGCMLQPALWRRRGWPPLAHTSA